MRPDSSPVIAAQAHAANTGLILMPDAFTIDHSEEITLLAARHRLPAVYPFRFIAELGGLLSYGNNRLDNFRSVATYAERIVKGERPAEPADRPSPPNSSSRSTSRPPKRLASKCHRRCSRSPTRSSNDRTA